ncbi:ankyrin repeat-containing domain protein, partial [Melanogaster broomeanus]
LEIAQILVEKGCPPNTEDPEGRTPLSLAASVGATEIVRFLLQNGCSLPPDVIHNVLRSSDLSLAAVRVYVESGADLHAASSNGNTALHTLLANSVGDAYVEIAQLFVEAGCNIHTQNSLGRTPIFYAVECHNASAVRYLVELGA